MLNPCELCSASCCKDYVITITSFDALRIMEKSGMKFREFAEIMPLRILNFDNETVLECWKGKLRYEYILALKSHPCIFLERNKCKIHGFAPLVCRLYPHNSGRRMAPGARCPPIPKTIYSIRGVDGGVEIYRKQIEGYRKTVAKWNRRKGSAKECVRFLLNESRKMKI